MWLFKSAHKHINQDTLSEYLDGRLQGTGLEQVEQRLGECDACRQELEELQVTVAMMRQLPMETPRRSFVMSAPPPEPARAQPFLVLRAPNWVYAGAASVAALALAVTISMDATGGLSSDSLSRDFAVTAMAPASESDQIITTLGTSGGTAEAASGSGDTEMAPTTMAAVAPAAATADTAASDEQAGGIAAFSAAEPLTLPPAPEARSADGGSSSTENQTSESQTSKALTTEAPAPVSEQGEPELFNQDSTRATSIWWRVLEAAAGALTVAFAIGLALRWRTNRRD